MSRPVPVLAGPTASGKTEIALRIAPALGAEIVSVDSRQVYRGLAVGSAAPTEAERARVRHHLVAVREPEDEITAGDYGKEVRLRIDALREKGEEALLVGGSGLYLRAALGGLDEGLPTDPDVRGNLEARADREGSAALHAELAAADPATGSTLAPRDRRRIVRALEILELTGRAPSELRRMGRATDVPARVVVLHWDRDLLEERIRLRVRAMIRSGLREETEALVARGLGPRSAALTGVGYAETVRHLQGELDEAAWEEAIVVNTRRYAKRQRTWFRSIPQAHWITVTPGSYPERAAEEALNALR